VNKNRLEDDYKIIIRELEAAVQLAAMALIYYLIWRYFYRKTYMPSYNGRGKWVLIGVYTVILSAVFRLGECFKFGYLTLSELFISQVIAAFIANFLTYFQLCLIANKMITPMPMLCVYVCDIVMCTICSYSYTRIYHKIYVPHDMLLIYGSECALDLKFKMDVRHDRYTITEIISADAGQEQIQNAINRHDAVIINDINGYFRNDILKYCYEHGVRTYLVPKISDIILEGSKDITLFDTPLKLIKGRGLTLPQRFFKRMTDIVLCLIALIISGPIMLIVALAIKAEDQGPVFYKQSRVTRDGKTFEILKFRSMVVDAERGGYDLSMRANGNDPRITKTGTFIRATRIDELPQIFNILKGDMSIVGPRPERVENVEEYSKQMPEWHMREKVKGGLTGYAQIYGKYNTSPMDKTKMDIMYIENYSLFLDFKLILLTVRVLFSKESTEGFDAVNERKQKREELIKALEHHE